jgi:hypothetical protein
MKAQPSEERSGGIPLGYSGRTALGHGHTSNIYCSKSATNEAAVTVANEVARLEP